MPSPTQIEVSLDSTEYSRYEAARNTINVVVTVAGTAFTSEEVVVELVKARRYRDAVVDFRTLSFTGSAPMSLSTSFHLPGIVDQDTINLVRFGKYFIRARSVSDPLITTNSPDFDVRIITTSHFKENYLFGIRLTSTEYKAVKYPLSNITGIDVVEVSKQSLAGFSTLNYTYTASPLSRTLSWDGGPSVTINGIGNYVLKRGGSNPLARINAFNDYIIVRVSSMIMLPSATTSDDVLIEEKSLTDDVIASYLDRTIAWIENDFLAIHLEPTVVVTSNEPTDYSDIDYDFLTSPLTYFSPQSGWLSINTPFLQLLRVDRLWGVIASTKVIEVDLHWIQISQQGGLVQLIPFSQNVAFNYLGLLIAGSVNSASELPNFWNFQLISGLRECTPDLRDLIAKKAALDLLGILGLALRPGIGSISLSRDGVSESVSYLAAQKYGNYTGLINLYKDQLEQDMPKFRAKYRGINMCVV